ncbi:hypothetical protein CR513_08956, partial [Mucuna pruriens]
MIGLQFLHRVKSDEETFGHRQRFTIIFKNDDVLLNPKLRVRFNYNRGDVQSYLDDNVRRMGRTLPILRRAKDRNFQRLSGEDPHKYLKEFHAGCSTIRPHGIPENYIKIKEFSFFLDGATKDYLYLQLILVNTWGDMKRMFLEKRDLICVLEKVQQVVCNLSSLPNQ